MKKVFISFSTGILMIFFIVSCKKQNSGNSTTLPYFYKDTGIIDVDSCKIIHYYNICFDTLLSESRCPYGAMCPWTGYAAIRLKCSFNNNQPFYLELATEVMARYRNDTTLNGINFRLAELTPHPAINIFYPYSAYKAKIIVSN
jgi:hypothetical protein